MKIFNITLKMAKSIFNIFQTTIRKNDLWLIISVLPSL